ncbi:hypothetical protein A8B75_10695 [Sphingomonadales bacterium EhC05]|nr:hypothetical protein A8B75_10695 [Sphingomonadales bacterium EhC05]
MLSDRHTRANSALEPHFFGKCALGLCLALGISGTAFAQSMVVRSVGPSASDFPAGKKLAADSKVTLKSQDQITIVSKTGTRVLKGPGTFTLNRRNLASSTTSTRLASFINNRGRTRGRTGAVRGAGTEAAVVAPRSPNLWFLDVTKGGKFCVANPNALVLWRPDYTGSASASIVEPINGGITQVEWRKGSPLKAWPKTAAPVSNGASYQLIGSNVPKSVAVSFVVLETQPQDLDEAAAALIENGCQSQLDLLVDMIGTGPSTDSDEG